MTLLGVVKTSLDLDVVVLTKSSNLNVFKSEELLVVESLDLEL